MNDSVKTLLNAIWPIIEGAMAFWPKAWKEDFVNALSDRLGIT